MNATQDMPKVIRVDSEGATVEIRQTETRHHSQYMPGPAYGAPATLPGGWRRDDAMPSTTYTREVPAPRKLTWAVLRKAAMQEDTETASLYAAIWEAAKKLARRPDCDLDVRVEQCPSGVGHRVAVRAVDGADCLFSLPRGRRLAHEGMEHHGGGDDGYSFAVAEAKEVHERLSKLPGKSTLSL